MTYGLSDQFYVEITCPLPYNYNRATHLKNPKNLTNQFLNSSVSHNVIVYLVIVGSFHTFISCTVTLFLILNFSYYSSVLLYKTTQLSTKSEPSTDIQYMAGVHIHTVLQGHSGVKEIQHSTVHTQHHTSIHNCDLHYKNTRHFIKHCCLS